MVSSEVERFLDTEEVRSSILLSPTIKDYNDSESVRLSEFLYEYRSSEYWLISSSTQQETNSSESVKTFGAFLWL